MKTKTIPFDLETAKKIQAGEIKGRIKNNEGENVRIVCWDYHYPNDAFRLIGLVTCDNGYEELYYYTTKGVCHTDTSRPDLVLEIQVNIKECEFTPFQCVLVRKEGGIWLPRLFDSYIDDEYWAQDGESYDYCIPYKDNDYLIGTDKEPNEQ